MYRKIMPFGFLALSACSFAIPDFRPGPSVVATPPPPVAAPLTARERFIATAAANGCVVNSATSGAILAGATLSSDDMGQIMQQLVNEGRGEIAADQQSFRVRAGACA